LSHRWGYDNRFRLRRLFGASDDVLLSRRWGYDNRLRLRRLFGASDDVLLSHRWSCTQQQRQFGLAGNVLFFHRWGCGNCRRQRRKLGVAGDALSSHHRGCGNCRRQCRQLGVAGDALSSDYRGGGNRRRQRWQLGVAGDALSSDYRGGGNRRWQRRHFGVVSDALSSHYRRGGNRRLQRQFGAADNALAPHHWGRERLRFPGGDLGGRRIHGSSGGILKPDLRQYRVIGIRNDDGFENNYSWLRKGRRRPVDSLFVDGPAGRAETADPRDVPMYGNGPSLSVSNFEALGLIGGDGSPIWMNGKPVRNGTR